MLADYKCAGAIFAAAASTTLPLQIWAGFFRLRTKIYAANQLVHLLFAAPVSRLLCRLFIFCPPPPHFIPFPVFYSSSIPTTFACTQCVHSSTHSQIHFWAFPHENRQKRRKWRQPTSVNLCPISNTMPSNHNNNGSSNNKSASRIANNTSRRFRMSKCSLQIRVFVCAKSDFPLINHIQSPFLSLPFHSPTIQC